MDIQYTTSEGVSIAYQVLGNSGPTLLHIPGAISHLALENSIPEAQRWYNDLATFCRVVRFDKRGTGLSDAAARTRTLDQQIADVEAVRAAVDADEVVLWGLSQGAPLAVLYAVTYPERVQKLVLMEGVCCDARDPAKPMSDANALIEGILSPEAMEPDFGAWLRKLARMIEPDASADQLMFLTAFLQATASPASYKAIARGLSGFDIRPMLRRVQAPTLVLHAKDDQIYPIEHGRYLAEHIAKARFIELDTSLHVPSLDEACAQVILAAAKGFILDEATTAPEGLPPVAQLNRERSFVTVLFTDIVNSTVQQRAAGDKAWHDTRTAFEGNAKRIVERHNGRIVQFTGDGVMAAFPGAGAGLHAARELVADARGLGLDLRAGLNTGEAYETVGDLHGLCVTIAARVSAEAGAGEILTTELVQGIVEGGGFTFEPFGEVDLKGIGPRKLVRLT